VIPHGGGAFDSIHFILVTPNSPWTETFMPPPGPDGIYARPPDLVVADARLRV
jgi:hypothetical protein